MKATLQRLGEISSFLRLDVSDETLYCEALFRTMKYLPDHPTGAFETIEQKAWVNDFIRRFNTSHFNSAIRFATSDDRHFGREENILANRRQLNEIARRSHPGRWSRHTRKWDPVRMVLPNPKDENRVALNLFLIKEA